MQLTTTLIWAIGMQGVAIILGGTALILRLAAEKRRSKCFIDIATQLRQKTGYTQSPLLDLAGFLEYLERYGFQNPNEQHRDEFNIICDDDLNNFVNLSIDMVRGRANMDTGILWMEWLDHLLDRLHPDSAPHHDGVPRQDCASCGSKNTTHEWVKSTMPYGIGEDAVEIPIYQPVYTCGDCKESFTNFVGEAIREREVQKHLASKA